MSEVTTLGRLVAEGRLILNDGYRTKKAELGEPGVPILRVADVSMGSISPSYVDFVSEQYRSKFAAKMSQPGDVVVTTKGTVGRVAQIDATDPELVYSPQICFFRAVRGGGVVPDFLRYWFQGPDFRAQALSVQAQTDMADYINLCDMRNLRIDLPTETSQQRVAEVLRSLDDKLASALRSRAIVMDLLVALFRRVRDASNGRVPLGQLATHHNGASYRREDLQPSPVALVTLKSFDRSGGYALRGLKPYAGRYKQDQVIRPGEFAVARTDLTQAAEVVGRVVRVPRSDDYDTLVASLDLTIVRPVGATAAAFLYGVLIDPPFREHCRSRTNGTTVLHLAKDALPDYQAPDVPIEAQEDFAVDAQPLLQADDGLGTEISVLAALRDALLPELLSGRLRVPEAEELVSDAM